MVGTPHAVLAPRLMLCANTAEELMTPNPVSVRDDATLQELIVLLTDKGITAAPVIDAAGHPVGVVSRTDVLAHDRESAAPGRDADETRVRDLMTPALFSVRPDTAAARVVEEMLAMKVHRLFVIDGSGVLVGVIDALDVLRQMQPECPE